MLEISPEVVEASSFFLRENHGALKDPRARLIVGDGRSHLALGTDRYDVLISEPSNPWMAGVAALFTREFFEEAKSRLGPGGLLCQWAHTYDISDRDLRSIVATFTAVFPHASLWLIGEGDILLIGSTDPIEPRLEGIRRAWTRPGVATDLVAVDVRDPETLLTLFTASGARLQEYGADAPLQTDDRMSLEFSGPQSIYGRSTSDNAAALRALARDDTLPAPVREARRVDRISVNRGLMLVRAEAFGSAFDAFVRALEHNPGDQAAIDGLLRAAAPSQRLGEAESVLRRITATDPRSVAAAVGLSRLIAGRGDYHEAAEPLRPLFGEQPDVRAMDQLASIFADAGDGPRLAAIVADLQRVAPDSDSALYYGASLQFMAGRPEEAIRIAERLRARNGAHARALNLLGAAYATVGRRDDARRAFEASVAADPRDPTAYANLGAFELDAGRAEAAGEYFAEALTLDPASPSAQDGLARAIAALQ
jgi:spermidine synthase